MKILYKYLTATINLPSFHVSCVMQADMQKYAGQSLDLVTSLLLQTRHDSPDYFVHEENVTVFTTGLR